MTLNDIVDKLADMVDVQVLIDDCGNILGSFDIFPNYWNNDDHYDYSRYGGGECDVISIDTDENGKLIVTIDGNDCPIGNTEERGAQHEQIKNKRKLDL